MIRVKREIVELEEMKKARYGKLGRALTKKESEVHFKRLKDKFDKG